MTKYVSFLEGEKVGSTLSDPTFSPSTSYFSRVISTHEVVRNLIFV